LQKEGLLEDGAKKKRRACELAPADQVWGTRVAGPSDGQQPTLNPLVEARREKRWYSAVVGVQEASAVKAEKFWGTRGQIDGIGKLQAVR
jgi:hypothetical protein